MSDNPKTQHAEYICGCTAAGSLLESHCPMHGKPQKYSDENLLGIAEKIRQHHTEHKIEIESWY